MKADLLQLSHEQLSLLHALLKLGTESGRSGTGEQLLAYYSTSNLAAEQGRAAGLRGIAQDLLPDHLVPDLFVPVAEIPRLANGKADTKRLPYAIVKRSGGAGGAVTAEREFDILASVLGDLLGFDEIRADDKFFELGGDSITAIRLVSRVRESGVPIDVKAVTSNRTLGEIALEASQRLHGPGAETTGSGAAKELMPAVGQTPLTPIQRWFFSQQHPQPEHWNLAGVVEVAGTLNVEKLTRCIHDTLAAHPVLGMSFQQTDSGFEGYIPDQPPPVELIQEIATVGCDRNSREVLLDDLQQGFSLADGWLIRFVLVNSADTRNSTLLWVCHHLVMDALSCSAFFNEVHRRYQHGMGCESVGLSYREWACRLHQYAQDRASPLSAAGLHSSVVNNGQAEELCESDCVSRVFVCTDINARESHGNTGSLLEVLLAGVATALAGSLQLSDLRIDIEHHGRDLLDGIDVTDSIGWFTSYFPCYLEGLAPGEVRDTLNAARSALELAREENSFYLLDRYYNGVEDTAWQSPSVLLNFQGVQAMSLDDGWALSFLHWDCLRSSGNRRSHDIEINAVITGQDLELMWRYDAHRFSNEFFSELEYNLEAMLRSLLQNTEAETELGNHPDLRLSQSQLDDFLDSLD